MKVPTLEDLLFKKSLLHTTVKVTAFKVSYYKLKVKRVFRPLMIRGSHERHNTIRHRYGRGIHGYSVDRQTQLLQAS